MYSSVFIIFILSAVLINDTHCLYPRESISREVKKLDGVWNFRICRQDDQEEGFRKKWYGARLDQSGDVIPMPVPCSFNDITQNKTIRDYVGWAWYDTTFYVPQHWKTGFRVVLRFGSVHYIAKVFLNGVSVMNHTGGHLPFEADVTSLLTFLDVNLLTVALNNTLTSETIPQGSKTFKPKPYPPGFYEQSLNFDFFNYAGIHRSVVLCAMPLQYIKDILIFIDIKDNTGFIKYMVLTETHRSLKMFNGSSFECFVTVLDKMRKIVVTQKGCNTTIAIDNPQLWWPFTMHQNPGYLYSLQVRLTGQDIIDVYEERFGIRTVAVAKNKFLVNGKPFYFMGFGKHEDSIIRGKGVDIPLVIKDFNLIKWVGANSFRTSHYPYAEEIMDQADEQGIVIINECPAVGLKNFNDVLLKQHRQTIKELISRDKNRPSVVAWSVANEPHSSDEAADSYFENVVSYTRELDATRPITAAINADPVTDKLGKYLDYIMMNRYFSWYSDTGSTEVIYPLLVNELTKAYEVYQKPIMMSEYGGDTISGLHMDPPFIFTEDYQSELMMNHHYAFNDLRKKGFFVGEHIWNFADFMTLQEITRVVGNKKGIFTRERQPKAAAKLLRCRYHKIANRTIKGSMAYCPHKGIM